VLISFIDAAEPDIHQLLCERHGEWRPAGVRSIAGVVPRPANSHPKPVCHGQNAPCLKETYSVKLSVTRPQTDKLTATWSLVFEIWFGWSLSQLKHAISQKPYSVKLSLTCPQTDALTATWWILVL